MTKSHHTAISPRRQAQMMVAILVFQLLFVFQGVDFSDEGFLATFYQNIFSHPGSVQYNFMFWFTGVIGGVFYKLTQPIGLLGLRLAGVLVVTTTAWVTLRIWSGRIPGAALMTGIALVVVNLNNDIKIVNYNNLSALFFVVIVLLLINNLERPRSFYLAIAGSLIAVNVFVRLPNILGVSLFALPLLAPGSMREKTRALISMAAGSLIGLAAVVLLLQATGQTDIFLNAFSLVREMSQAKTQKGIVGGNYGLLKILTQFRSDVLHSVLYALLLLGLLIGMRYALTFLGRKDGPNKSARIIVPILFAVATIGLILSGRTQHFSALYLFHGAGILAVLLVLHRKMPLDIQFISFAGLLVMLSYPVGSAQGILTAGKYCLWITTPIAIHLLADHGGPSPAKTSGKGLSTWGNRLPDWTGTIVRNAVIASLITFGLYYSCVYPFFDHANRFAMHHGVKNEHMRMIVTTRERSLATNELLEAAKAVIRPGDTVLAYDCIPLFHFMTESTPFLHNSYPWLYASEAFQKDLALSSSPGHAAPVVVRQKIQTIGDGGGWPARLAPTPYGEWEVNADRNRTMDRFLASNGYKVYWESPFFQILLPQYPRGNPVPSGQ